MMRVLDGDGGGAADLQTDVMRFMAILSLCLLAIFALVQSLPPVTTSAVPEPAVEPRENPPVEPIVEAAVTEDRPAPALVRPPAPEPAARPLPVTLTRAKAAPAEPTASPMPERIPEPAKPASAPPNDTPGFTLRFESDLALTRLVATGQVGVFAIANGSAQRMSVAASRISFWAAPVPAAFHEMDKGTVPAAARDALERTGRSGAGTQWAVTLPARLSTDLSQIMRAHQGGTLVIAKDGSLRRESR